MHRFKTRGLCEARESGTVSEAGYGTEAYEAAIELRFGKAYDLREVADKLGISLRQVQAHIDDGGLVAVNVGRGGERRDLRVLEDDLDGFVLRRKTSAATAPTSRRPKMSGRAVPMASPGPGYAERRAARLARREGR